MIERTLRCRRQSMLFLWAWIEKATATVPTSWIMGGGGAGSRFNVGVAVGVTALAGLALAATFVITSRRGSLKSSWSRRRRKHALTMQQWRNFFTPEGKIEDGGVQLLKKVRTGGIDPSIRAEVWPFLLGVYDLNSTETERLALIEEKRKEYDELRKQCIRLLKHTEKENTVNKGISEVLEVESPNFNDHAKSTKCDDSSVNTLKSELLNDEDMNTDEEDDPEKEEINDTEEDKSGISEVDNSPDKKTESSKPEKSTEDFDTWQRIIRLDAIRANAEWVAYSPSQAAVSEETALKHARSVDLKDYEHLEPCRIYHAARLVAILEAYAVHDRETGYCQGMSDLLSPLLAVVEEDGLAFWCFAGFMRKARHNFRLDEAGIRRQLSMVSRIIRHGDAGLYRHLEKMEAEDCFFVYRMVVVLFRRELGFEQVLCLWEVMWADQAAVRAGLERLTRGRVRAGAPPTDDLLLYAIAACVLQRRKLIIESYSSVDEILRECNSMAGKLDVWKLLDDAHDLVAGLHDKI